MSVIENRILGSSVFNQGRSQIAGHPDTCDFKAQLVWLWAPERASCGSFPHWKAERDLVRWSVGGAVGPWWRLPLVSSEGCQPGCCNVCGTPEALRTQNPPGCTQEKILCCTSFYLNLFPQIHFSITVIYVFCFFFFFCSVCEMIRSEPTSCNVVHSDTFQVFSWVTHRWGVFVSFPSNQEFHRGILRGPPLPIEQA